ncbi:stage II sporulation protein R [Laceyella sacchari]|jgi:stage II sporulation protein R|uniref:Stage II sporulation protein R n=2 Tax=Laceyella TaxID=292635 RepID=A0AA45WQR7_9BACL|nr:MULTISPECIES: stage II sporulation protein R [Laceyella]AUS10228.1 stage II sporulation protein R [Laceyella sacchari]PRZ16525.1 stage II sporulation protein R [Laceyella sediminis]SMP26424.1 stage II sporulation protein R [Laceyella tengchongensis]
MCKRTIFLFLLSGFILCSFVRAESSAVVSGRQAPDHPEKGIPEQAIRLRILANSDQLRDQWLKRKVRDELVKEIETWAEQPGDIGEARQLIRSRLPRFQALAERTVAQHGFDYPVKVDFGRVPFPTKLYGEKVYPAGNYEALRVTIGRGEGENWWCVLFPPLCFIDMSNGDAVEPPPESLSASLEPTQPAQPKEEKIQVRFFLLDKLLKK